MQKRIDLLSEQPAAAKAMYGLVGYLGTTGIAVTHKHLITIRASQINRCAYCIDMHTKEALSSGETMQRIFLLNAWRETDLFTREEKAVLALTEEVTLISEHGVSDEVYSEAETLFGNEGLAQMIMAIVTINAWNRISVSTHKTPDA